MLQHMQYTVDKCVYFLYSALLNHKRQEQHQQQSAATMPSKPAVTGKCQCFKNPTPLMSAAVGCVCSRVYAALCQRVCQKRPARALPSIQQARTMHTQVVGTDSKKGHTTRHSTHSPADTLVPFRQTPPPEHPTTSAAAHRTASPPSGRSLETKLQQLNLSVVGKMSPQKLLVAFKKRHKDL